jgi:hypothetical protein
MKTPTRRFAASCLLILAAAACRSEAPEIRSPEMVNPTAFDGAPPLPIDDSAIAPPIADPPDPTPAPVPPIDRCDANYSPCVPIDSDVDCAGGRGNGPSFVSGPVKVIGRDIYGLDRDGDGIGCDRG